MAYVKIPILDAAEQCGININPRTKNRTEVEAYCPFCEGSSNHLFLNTDSDKFYCQKCGARGNSVSLYAKVMNLSNREAFEQLSIGKVFKFPQKRIKSHDNDGYLADLSIRHDVYYDMLSLLSLSEHHKQNLLNRGLSEERICENRYRSMPADWQTRKQIANKMSQNYDLRGMPGFFTQDGQWNLCGKAGIIIPVCNINGYIQGCQIRLDNTDKKKYRWLSSNPQYGFENGTRAYSWVHVTGNRHSGSCTGSPKVACVTEGGLKGDIASYLRDETLFVCVPGVCNTELLVDTLKELDVKRVVGCYDMDCGVNSDVQIALDKMKLEIKQKLHIEYEPFAWNPKYNGIDEYLYARKMYKQAA